jgi:hypothetical protein
MKYDHGTMIQLEELKRQSTPSTIDGFRPRQKEKKRVRVIDEIVM